MRHNSLFFMNLFWLAFLGNLMISCSSSLPTVSFQSKTLPLRVAQTPLERNQWLRGTGQTLSGLFVMDFGYASRHNFHMYKVYLPLMAYGVDETGKIQNIFEPKAYDGIQEVTEMECYESDQPIRYFYFLPKPLGQQLKLKIGQQLELFSTTPVVCEAYLNGKKELSLIVLQRPEELERGMMHRKYLSDEEGMLFLFKEPGERSFWMKNCKIPLDLAYLDENDRIQEIHEMTLPPKGVPEEKFPRYPSRQKYAKVLEVPQNWFKTHQVKIGDLIIFQPPLKEFHP